MLWTLVVVFFILWVLALVHVFTIGAWIWLFFAIWIMSLIARFVIVRAGTPRTHQGP